MAPRRRRTEPAYDTLPTEAAWAAAADLDALPTHRVVELLARREQRSVTAVRRAGPAIARVAEAVARAMERGGRLVYVGAGTSGRLGALDAAECPPTFGTDPSRVVAVLAGGPEAMTRAVEGAEDRGDEAERAVTALRVGARDVVVGIAASGVTPFVATALRVAAARRATTALVTCAARAARAAGLRPDVLVGLDVGPEVLAGSTRLGAGTATKLALNAITTAAMVRTGRAYGPYMVDVRPTNAKLRARARRLVRELAGVRESVADAALTAADWDVKTAIVMARQGIGAEAARRALAKVGGRLRALLGPPPRRPR